MRTAWVVLVGVLLAASSARANPVSITLSERDAEAALGKLVERAEEPIGLFAAETVPELGLQKGDVVRAINGAPPVMVRLGFDRSAVHYLDVVRGTTTLLVRVTIKLGPKHDRTERAWFKDMVERLRKYGNDIGSIRQATKNGRPSGVLVGMFVGIGELVQGDVIRKIDGKPVKTVDDALRAFERGAANPQIVFDVERVGQPFTLTLHLTDPAKDVQDLDAAIAKIKKQNDTTYLVPRVLVDTIIANPMAIAKGARVVPAMKNGKPEGMKLYAIRPTSVYFALGLQNGDTVVKINGQELTSADRALEVYTKIQSATSLQVELVRRGKPLTLVWKLGQ